jgi:hypothetical protein
MSHRTFFAFVEEEDGFILSSELLLLGSISVVGLLVGLVSIRDSVLLEFDDFSKAIGLLDQSLTYAGVSDDFSSTEGGLLDDNADVDEPGGVISVDDPSGSISDGELSGSVVDWAPACSTPSAPKKSSSHRRSLDSRRYRAFSRNWLQGDRRPDCQTWFIRCRLQENLRCGVGIG